MMMKKIIIAAILLCCSTLLGLASESKRFDNANKLYSEEKYQEADSLYQLVMQEEGVSSALYYNIGNTKYKLGEIAPAILFYERALLLDPNNEDVKFNLEMAKLQTTDKIEQLDNFFLNDWNNTVQSTFSANGWAYACIVLFLISLIGISIYFFGNKLTLRKLAFFSSIATFLCCIFAGLYANKQKNEITSHNTAIIFAPSVTGKGSPDNGGTDLFLLHEGTKVKVKSKLNGWVEIQMSDGNVGWVPENTLEVI